MPFSFSDGQGCSNYNQLVLACDQRWNEARGFLLNGIWKSFFAAIGRADLANLAVRAANETDPDIGLCRLLEGLPADAEALCPPMLALTSTTEDLGALEPGTDYKFNVVIENRGMLLLRGSIVAECDWLAFGDHQGNGSAKLFQTRDTYTLSVRVLGSKLRAGKQPLEAQIVIDTNGGRETVIVRATVPARPFPGGDAAFSNVLAGATTPREIAVKAKAHPDEAAVLFEQGMVKAWYESNGWTYPVRGTQAKGKGALQQFFEALGLTKPPRLEIDTQSIVCQGQVGKRLTKRVILRTTEPKFVHAEAHSNQDWIKVLPGTPQGNSITVPLRIEVPPRPGETLEAIVTFIGNGQQRFVVPVTLTAEAKTDEQEEATANRVGWRTWTLAGGVVLLGLVIALAVMIKHWRSPPVNPSSPGRVASSTEPHVPVPPVPPVPPGPPQDPPERKVETWWHKIPGTNLTASVAQLKAAAGKNLPIFESIESDSAADRGPGYDQLAEKLSELARNDETRKALGQFVMECYVHEPSDLNLGSLLRGLARLFPAEDSPFLPDDKGEQVERAFFWLGVVCDTITHKAALPERSRSLASRLNDVLGSTLEPGVPPKEFQEQAEKALAQHCYRNLLPTAEKSIEQALTIRENPIAKWPQRLDPEFRSQIDVKLLDIGLSKSNDLWPRLEPIFKDCLESKGTNNCRQLIALYEKANAELAPKMEVLLAGKWKVAGNPKLTPAEKAGIIHERIAAEARAAKIPPAERKKRFQQLLAKGLLSTGKPKGQPPPDPLPDAVRLAHASTLAAILFNKDAEKAQFDALIGQIPGSEPDKTVEGKKPETKTQKTGIMSLQDTELGKQWTTDPEKLREEKNFDVRRETYYREFKIFLRAGEKYVIDMHSEDFKPYLRLESPDRRATLAEHKYNDKSITFFPPADEDYYLVASSVEKNADGKFTLHIQRPKQNSANPMGNPFARNPFVFPQNLPLGNPPNPNPPKPTPRKPNPRKSPSDSKTDESKASTLNPKDLEDLGNTKSEIRIEAFKKLTRGLPNDLPYREAKLIAKYLSPPKGEASEADLEAITGQLPALAECPNVLVALADAMAGAQQQRTEAIVGGVLQQKNLSFAADEDWQRACRKLLLQRAWELQRGVEKSSSVASGDPDQAADSLRFLYREQARAFGLDDQDSPEQETPLTTVVEGLIKHVAATAAQQKLAAKDKAYLEQIGRHLQAARFAAGENDLEYMVRLQRIWIQVLVLALQQRVKAQASMRAVPQELDKKDRAAVNLLDQLRLGEENILGVWVIAHDLKLK
jgi:hypothetical protein